MQDEIISTNADVIGDFWTKVVYPHAAAIFEADERLEPDPIGSAVRVRFSKKEYLVTADHVIEPHLQGSGRERPQGAPYAYIPEQIDIEGEVVTAGDPIDLAIIPLPSASRPGLSLPQHLALDVEEGERCLFVGFQARSKSWEINSSSQAIRPRPLSYMGTVLKASDLRFSIGFNEKQLYRSGAKQNAIGKLNGISGAGVYVIRNDAPKLAGIVIESQARASEIIATRSTALLGLFDPG